MDDELTQDVLDQFDAVCTQYGTGTRVFLFFKLL